MPSALHPFRRLREGKSLSIKKQITYLNRLSKLLNKGYPILGSLKMASWDPAFHKISSQLMDELNSGSPIDTAFKKANFSPRVVAFLYFARIHKDLPLIIQQCADLLELQYNYSKKLSDSLRYPLLLFIFLILSFTVIKHTILPSFQTLFNDSSAQPWSLMILDTVDILITSIFFTFVALICFCAGFYALKHRLSTSQLLNIYEKIPIAKNYLMFTVTFSFATHLSSLLKAGLSLKPALELIKDQNRSPYISYYADHILKQLNEGQLLGASVQSCSFLREEMTSIFHHTTDLQNLSRELQVLSELLIDQLKEKLTKIILILQPVFFLGVACIVVLIYASIMLPLYQWLNEI
ncbi:competence type IV pilus assembly protein ComGB [Halobacillus sp. Marseille-Q1614]|uniref:competence type IV pilus assembly protein ComGB n=1 Tax=Halobacillus sp. Marseille-Q1614 TaxID=2709134 RepID=UPI00156F2112|nr:competence type IV pilus assembly protein ComGB [Halobacillus sp. Marseille-Q1614]